MTLRSAVDILALLASSVYCTIPLFWLIVHPFIARWRKRGRRAYAFILPVWGIFIAMRSCSRGRIVSPTFTRTGSPGCRGGNFLCRLLDLPAAFRSFDHTQVSGLADSSLIVTASNW